MKSPFPGMDPYLESPAHWSDFHPTFIQTLREALNDVLPPNYVARIDEEIVMLEPEPYDRKKAEPDVAVIHDPLVARSHGAGAAIAERATSPVTLENVESLDPHTEVRIDITRLPERQVVTVIELLSPTNKSGDGRGLYLEKRHKLLRRPINVVEIDLIRAGRRLRLNRPLPPAHYYGFISRADRRPKCDVYAWTLRDALPALPIPLLAPDHDVHANLAAAFDLAYARGRYERSVNYAEPPPPPALSAKDAEWVAETAGAGAKPS